MLYNLMTATVTPVPDSVSGILDATGDVVTNILSWVGNIATTIIQTPVLFIGVGLFVMGAAVSFLRRLLRR